MITVTNTPRFLLIQTAFIGDVILATALLEQLHQLRPNAVLDVVVRRGNEGLLTGHPFVKEVLSWDKKGGALAKYRNLWQLWRTIRPRRYDLVLNLQRFGATGLLTALSGATTTVGYAKNPFSRFFTHRVVHRFAPDVHEIDRNAGLLHPLFGTGSKARTRPKLYPAQADYDAVRPYRTEPYVCIAPTSVWFTKQYPAQRWAELIRRLPAKTNVYLLGAPADASACETILTESGNTAGVVNLAGKLSLLQSAALQQGALMNYVNDSAPLHLCSAMNAPTTAVFCSTVPELGFGPLSDQSRIVRTPEELPCIPCNLHGRPACPLGHFRCAWSIEVGDLLAGYTMSLPTNAR